MAEPNNLRVRSFETGSTLAEFIARRLNISGKKAKTCLDSRNVFVNGMRIWMARHKLKTGDEVRVGGITGPSPAASFRTPRMNPSVILFQDDDYLVVNKPPGITTNGAGGLESMLRSLPVSAPSRGREPSKPAAVHRLDRDTSGCVIFAKRPEAKKMMIPLFAGRAVRKTYHALVKGRLAGKEFAITRPVDGRSAVTRVRVLDANRSASHVLVVIDTGRTHQIRKHFNGIHHPVIGDPVYSTRRRASDAEMSAPRQMLHAFQIGFKHPVSGRLITCEAPLPGDFMRCLKRYRLT